MNDMIKQRKECGKNTFATNIILKKMKFWIFVRSIVGNYRDSLFCIPQNLKRMTACMSFDPGLR